mmetsp:Transcript_33422/g.77624  ORF Transcript_33422/g.77624 Transcript_33422/m.77624 type:complete len:300 (-) Transcript_33422:95-994(-)
MELGVRSLELRAGSAQRTTAWQRQPGRLRCGLSSRVPLVSRSATVALAVGLAASVQVRPGAGFATGLAAHRGLLLGGRHAGPTVRQSAAMDVDYGSLTVQELRGLLKERGLVRKGRKEDLVQRLRRHDAGNQESSDDQTVVGVASSAAAGRAVEAIRPGDTVYLRAHTGRHLEVEAERVRARWDDHGDWQALVMEKSPLVIEDTDDSVFQSGDMVFLKAHTGHFVDIDGEDVRARWADQNHGMKWQGLVIVKHGSGAIVPGDTVFLQSDSGSYIDVQGDEVRARWPDEGDWQALVLEKE